MSLGIKADDWQVCNLIALEGGRWVGVGIFVFDFYSEKAAVSARFVFKGGGIGAGGNASGTILPTNMGPVGSRSFSKIDIINAFSVWDLNGARGRVGSFGGGMGVGFGIMAITAAPPWTWDPGSAYFISQDVGGYGTGIGAGGGLDRRQLEFQRRNPKQASQSNICDGLKNFIEDRQDGCTSFVYPST